jgi:acyl carrier protein
MIYTKLKRILEEMINIPGQKAIEINKDTVVDDIGLDELDYFVIVDQIEKTFYIQIEIKTEKDIERMERIDTVQDAVEWIEELINTQKGA